MTEQPELNMLDDPSHPIERVTKIDAARRQLKTAIRLFFEDRDAVSIYTLTAASHELLRQLVKAKGGGSLLKDGDFIKPEHVKEYHRLCNVPQNFFKHADRDIDGTLDFKPVMTAFLIFDCAFMYKKITGAQFREMWVFAMWFTLAYPQFLKPGPVLESAQRTIAAGTLTKTLCVEMIEQPKKWPQANLE